MIFSNPIFYLIMVLHFNEQFKSVCCNFELFPLKSINWRETASEHAKAFKNL
jgi:hypothetical protein